MELHEIPKDAELPFLSEASDVESVDVVLPVVLQNFVIAQNVILQKPIGLCRIGHGVRQRLMNVVAVVLHTHGLLLRQGKVCACAPVETVGVSVLVVED